jgi:hypothetical protein
MKNSELRGLLFRIVTAVVFTGAIALLRNQSVYASPHEGSCSQLQMSGCDESHFLGNFCWEPNDCADIYDGEPPWDLCYCMNENYCDWWPGGCS